MSPPPVQARQQEVSQSDPSDLSSVDLAVQGAMSHATSVGAQTQFVHEIDEGKLYNANQPASLPNRLAENLGQHFEQCITHNLPLISFHSPRGYRKCLDLINATNTVKSAPQVPTALQQLMSHGFDKPLNIRTSNGETLELLLKKEDVKYNDKNDVPYFTASVKVMKNGNESTLEILEMAPQFDGKALRENDLQTCYELAKDFSIEKLPGQFRSLGDLDATLGQFTSAKGVGRSAAMLILSKFDETLQSTQPLSWPKNFNDATELIADIVEQLQTKTGNAQFGYLCNHDMKQSLANICLRRTETKLDLVNRLAQARASQPAVSPTIKSTPVAAVLSAAKQPKPQPAVVPQVISQRAVNTQQIATVNRAQPKFVAPEIKLYLGSILDLKVDVIVNAANSELKLGGGICGAIYNKAGQKLHEATQNAHPNGCTVGDAKIVMGKFGDLNTKAVIHAVGPDCRLAEQKQQKEALLRYAYIKSIQLAEAQKLKSISFPALSTGIYGYNLNEATPVAVKAVKDALKDCKHLKTVVFGCFNENEEIAYQMALSSSQSMQQTNHFVTPQVTSSKNSPQHTQGQLTFLNPSMNSLATIENGQLVSRTILLKTRNSNDVKIPINLLDVNIENALKTQIIGFKEAMEKMTPEQKLQLSYEIFSGVYAGDTLGSASESISPTKLIPKFKNGVEEDSRIETIKKRITPDVSFVQALCLHPLKRDFHTTDDTQQFALGLDQLLDDPDLQVDGEQLSNRFATPGFIKPVYDTSTNQWGKAEVINDCHIIGSANSIATLRFYKEKQGWESRTLLNLKREHGKLIETENVSMAAGNGGLMRIAYTMIGAIADPEHNLQKLFENVLVSGQVTHPDCFAHTTNVAFVKLLGDCIVQRNKDKNISELKGTNFFINSMLPVMKSVEQPDRLYGLEKMICTPAQKRRLGDGYYQSQGQFLNHVNSDEATIWRTPRLPHQFLDAEEFQNSKKRSEQAIYQGSVAHALKETKDWPKLDVNKDEDCQKVADFLSRWNTRSYLGATLPTIVFLLEKFGYDNPLDALKLTALVTQDNDTCAAIVGAVLGALHGGVEVQDDGNVKWGHQTLFGAKKPDGTLDGKSTYIDGTSTSGRYRASDLKKKMELVINP